MYVKIDGQLKSIKKFETKSSSTTIYIHSEDEEESLKIYKCPLKSVNNKHIRRLFAPHICVPRDLECGNEELIIWMHQLDVSISQSHTNTRLNRITFNCNWKSINLGERKITNIFWLPDGSPLQVRIDPVEILTTVAVTQYLPAQQNSKTSLWS